MISPIGWDVRSPVKSPCSNSPYVACAERLLFRSVGEVGGIEHIVKHFSADIAFFERHFLDGTAFAQRALGDMASTCVS